MLQTRIVLCIWMSIVTSCFGSVSFGKVPRIHKVNIQLISAIRRNNTRKVKLLIAEKANPDALDIEGKSALILASQFGNLQIVKVLLKNGANINMMGGSLPHDQNALMAAVNSNHYYIAKLLLNAGANVNAQNNDGETALMFASTSSIAKLLINSGADVNAQTKEFGNSVISIAVTNGNIKVVDLLMKSGAKLNVRNRDGETPLLLAKFYHNRKMVRLLEKARPEH